MHHTLRPCRSLDSPKLQTPAFGSHGKFASARVKGHAGHLGAVSPLILGHVHLVANELFKLRLAVQIPQSCRAVRRTRQDDLSFEGMPRRAEHGGRMARGFALVGHVHVAADELNNHLVGTFPIQHDGLGAPRGDQESIARVAVGNVRHAVSVLRDGEAKGFAAALIHAAKGVESQPFGISLGHAGALGIQDQARGGAFWSGIVVSVRWNVKDLSHGEFVLLEYWVVVDIVDIVAVVVVVMTAWLLLLWYRWWIVVALRRGAMIGGRGIEGLHHGL
mmetsp:Transcript_9624/g.26620  ORF Transcript_9624/g.26620 Transcript_9624/m.26620 type:complete len:276 (+) Transcript_9624:360-1187(+)